jgi:ATP-dependent Clp protease ATP-binding subunit ClpA
VIDDGEPRPTAAFQRVSDRAVIHVQSSGREGVMGANVLVAIFAERKSPTAYFLQEQEMTRDDVTVSRREAETQQLSYSPKIKLWYLLRHAAPFIEKQRTTDRVCCWR